MGGPGGGHPELNPLFSALRNGSVGVTRALLAAGADLEVRDSAWRWHMDTWIRNSGGDITALQAGLFMTLGGGTGNHVEVVKILLEGGAHVEDEDIFKVLPQCDSSHRFHGGEREPELLKDLLDAGVSVDVTNEKGETPLMVASRCGFPRSVRLLLDAGAGWDIRDEDNTTALLQAKMLAKSINDKPIRRYEFSKGPVGIIRRYKPTNQVSSYNTRDIVSSLRIC